MSVVVCDFYVKEEQTDECATGITEQTIITEQTTIIQSKQQ